MSHHRVTLGAGHVTNYPGTRFARPKSLHQRHGWQGSSRSHLANPPCLQGTHVDLEAVVALHREFRHIRAGAEIDFAIEVIGLKAQPPPGV